jgi:PAS domain S-box-containing protein
MDWTLIFGFFSLISGMICAGIAIYLAPYRKKRGAGQLMLLMTGISIWTLGYGMELLSPDLSLKLWWVKIEYMGVSWLGVLIFTFVCTLTGKTDYLKKKRHLLLFVVPVLTILLALTNEFHGLMWQQAHLESNSAIQGIVFERTPLFWGYTAFSYGLIFWTTVILIKAVASSRGLYRKQLTLILTGVMVPWLFNGLYLFKFQTIQHLDLTPFAFMVSGILFAWGFLRYQLLNLIPLAHKAVMDSMGDPVIVMDMNDRVMEINRTCSKTFAIESFKQGQASAKELFPELYQLVDAYRGKKAVKIEAGLTLQGILRQWDVRMSPLLTPQKKQSGWLIVLRDITQHKQDETALRKSEERHRTMLEVSPTPIVYYSEKGDVTYANPAFTRVFGWDCDELMGKPLDFIPENQKKATENAISQAFSLPEGNFNFITQRYTKDRELLDVSINAARYRDKEGNQTSLVVNYTDITRMRKVEQELRFARDSVKSIINSMPSILIGVDDQAMITQWNAAAEKITGIPADHARGKSLATVFPLLADIVPEIFAAIKNQQVQKQEKRSLVIHQKKFVTDIAVYPILSDNLQGAVIRMDDISERIKIEEMMVQSEKMMSVGGLAAGMAHEINNPLAGILQNIQVIRNRLSKPQPANIKAAKKHGIDLDFVQAYMEERGIFHMMDQVDSVGKRAAKIVENMLSFSRKSDSTRSRHSLQEMMASTLNLMKNDYSLKNQHDFRAMEILHNTQDTLPAVPCEKTKIQQVLFNILKNGTEAMATAKVAAPRFVIRYFMDGHMAAVEIRDNGPGIPEKIQNRIFEPFFTTKEVGIGTGLGLSVSYFIIKENHNGIMTVESAPGKGTAFVIKLPV